MLRILALLALVASTGASHSFSGSDSFSGSGSHSGSGLGPGYRCRQLSPVSISTGICAGLDFGPINPGGKVCVVTGSSTASPGEFEQQTLEEYAEALSQEGTSTTCEEHGEELCSPGTLRPGGCDDPLKTYCAAKVFDWQMFFANPCSSDADCTEAGWAIPEKYPCCLDAADYVYNQCDDPTGEAEVSYVEDTVGVGAYCTYDDTCTLMEVPAIPSAAIEAATTVSAGEAAVTGKCVTTLQVTIPEGICKGMIIGDRGGVCAHEGEDKSWVLQSYSDYVSSITETDCEVNGASLCLTMSTTQKSGQCSDNFQGALGPPYFCEAVKNEFYHSWGQHPCTVDADCTEFGYAIPEKLPCCADIAADINRQCEAPDVSSVQSFLDYYRASPAWCSDSVSCTPIGSAASLRATFLPAVAAAVALIAAAWN